MHLCLQIPDSIRIIINVVLSQGLCFHQVSNYTYRTDRREFIFKSKYREISFTRIQFAIEQPLWYNVGFCNSFLYGCSNQHTFIFKYTFDIWHTNPSLAMYPLWLPTSSNKEQILGTLQSLLLFHFQYLQKFDIRLCILRLQIPIHHFDSLFSTPTQFLSKTDSRNGQFGAHQISSQCEFYCLKSAVDLLNICVTYGIKYS